MCVTFIYLNDEAIGDANKFQLILLNNRDENFDRPTSLASWENEILAGRDEALPVERGGTWLGVKKNGKIGVLLSMLEKNDKIIPGAPTRGRIVKEYLESNESAQDFALRMSHCAHLFNGFNLLLLDRINGADGRKVYRLVNLMNNHSDSVPETLGSGIYGFGNSRRQTPFKKVRLGTRLFEEKIRGLNGQTREELLEQFIEILRDTTCHHPDDQLMSQTEQSADCSKAMSQIFYRFPHPYRYGTRSHTAIMVDGIGHVTFLERSQIPPPADLNRAEWLDTLEEFQLQQ